MQEVAALSYTAPTVPEWRRVRAVLAEQMLRHRELAHAAGVSEQTISRYLTGQRVPGERAAHRIVHGLHVLGVIDAVKQGAVR